MKKVLKAIWDEFIYGGHLLALGPAIIIFTTVQMLSLKQSPVLLFSIYLITYVVYYYDRISGLEKESSTERTNLILKTKKLSGLIIFLSILIIFFLLIKHGWITLFYGIFLVSIGLLYGLLFKKLTQSIIGFKSYFVAIVFSSVVFFIPLFYKSDLPMISFVLVFIFFFIRWFINTTYCDSKDREQDKKDGLKTFAVSLSPHGFYSLLIIMNFISIIPLLAGIYLKALPTFSILLSLSCFYSIFYIYQTTKHRYSIQFLTNVMADAESILWLILILIGEKLWI